MRLPLTLLIVIAGLVSILYCNGEESGATIMRQMWSTPIQTTNVLNGQGRDLYHPLIRGLRKEISFQFQKFSSNASLVNTYRRRWELHRDASLSDIFYFYQFDIFKEVDANVSLSTLSGLYKKFRELVANHVSTYLRECHVADDRINSMLEDIRSNRNGDSIFIWASIHQNGSHHQAHHHVNSVVSGVLYVSIPTSPNNKQTLVSDFDDDSPVTLASVGGQLVFEDPRGSLPPFGKTFRFSPTAGDLVLFPGWLVHRVEPTVNTAANRISVSFNIAGKWEDTSDLNNGYFV